MRPFKPEHYFRAAVERMEQARALYHLGSSYALAMYTAGLAVECMLRAYKGRQDPTFDEKHDLQRLFKASGLLATKRGNRDPSAAAQLAADIALQAAVNDVHIIWSNDYRFASEERLRSALRKMKLNVGIKGDYLKENARRLLDTAQKVIEKGVVLWTS